MIDINIFDDIRPYEDHEVGALVEKVLKLSFYNTLIRRFFPGKDPDKLKLAFLRINSIYDFQVKVIYPILKKLINDTSTGLTYSGFDKLKKGIPNLFISNHHDIILDPSVLNMLLYENGFNTTKVAIGDNLLRKEWIRDLARLNKSFIVHRSPSGKEAYYYSQRLSNYIKKTIIDDKESVWIAQREGRAKDGNDITQVSLLKMLAYGGEESRFEYLKSLNFLPTAISYEFDPCDILKVRESIAKEKNLHYEKNEKEDEISMVTGLTGFKGRIHISIGNVIQNEFDEILHHETPKEQFSALAAIIDEQIQSNIKLWPTNYIAYDLLMGIDSFNEEYTDEEKQKYIQYIEARLVQNKMYDPEGRARLLSIYANPVKNKIRFTNF
ncbi:MAG: 1-acyl-sn-glycerol-3-phosphate acyltransferase [Cyclobacteriaceae bacterium]|jgi:hypothetical protein